MLHWTRDLAALTSIIRLLPHYTDLTICFGSQWITPSWSRVLLSLHFDHLVILPSAYWFGQQMLSVHGLCFTVSASWLTCRVSHDAAALACAHPVSSCTLACSAERNICFLPVEVAGPKWHLTSLQNSCNSCTRHQPPSPLHPQSKYMSGFLGHRWEGGTCCRCFRRAWQRPSCNYRGK